MKKIFRRVSIFLRGGVGESRVEPRSIFGICRKVGGEGVDMRAAISSREHRGEQRTGYFVGPQNPSHPFSPALRANKGRLHAKLVQDGTGRLFVFH